MHTMLFHHYNFVHTHIETILEEAISACKYIGNGIETYPLCDYMCQSIFLQMTGFQEQKMKCICWDISTVDYDFRRDWLKDLGKNGEFSSLDSKNWVYKKIINRIEVINGTSLDINACLNKPTIVSSVINSMKEIFEFSVILKWVQRDYMAYNNSGSLLGASHFANKCLLEKCLSDVYIILYNQRNRCAHNTLSYQENIPTLKMLASDLNIYTNYFIWFALLMVIDRVFVKLYDTYLDSLDNNI